MKVTASLWEMLRNNISSKNRSREREKAGKDPFPAKHLNLWNGCDRILYIDIQAGFAFSGGYMAAKKQDYGNESISSLKGADRVRKRPGVIFGSDGLDGCEHAVF